ncbi:MAG: hypothetical protein ABS960_00600 [Solibacillus isronensis]
MANGLFGGGDGTQASPYLIEDVADFLKLPDHQNDKTKYFKLTNDISFKDIANWTPINFGSQLDGNFHTLSDITCISPDNCAIFNSIYNGATIENVFFKNIYVEGTDTYEYAAILGVYMNYGALTFRNISIQGTVKGFYASGFGYQFGGLAENISLDINIIGQYYGNGFAHYLNDDAVIRNLSVKGAILVPEDGESSGCVSGLSYSINEGAQIRNAVLLAKLSFDVNLSGTYSGKVHPVSNDAYPNSWNYGKYTLENVIVDVDTKGPTRGWEVSRNYSTGPFWYIRGADGRVYRNTGWQDSGNAAYEPGIGASWGDYWEDVLTAGAQHEDVTYKSTAEMRLQSTFAGFDFTDVWHMLDGQSYPKFQFEGPPTPPYVELEQYMKINGNWMIIK